MLLPHLYSRWLFLQGDWSLLSRLPAYKRLEALHEKNNRLFRKEDLRSLAVVEGTSRHDARKGHVRSRTRAISAQSVFELAHGCARRCVYTDESVKICHKRNDGAVLRFIRVGCADCYSCVIIGDQIGDKPIVISDDVRSRHRRASRRQTRLGLIVARMIFIAVCLLSVFET